MLVKMMTKLHDLSLAKMVVVMWQPIAKTVVRSSDLPSVPLVKMVAVTCYMENLHVFQSRSRNFKQIQITRTRRLVKQNDIRVTKPFTHSFVHEGDRKITQCCQSSDRGHGQ